jgi:hypothetical protein
MDQKWTGTNADEGVMHAYVVSPTTLPPGYRFTASLPDQPDVTFEVEVVRNVIPTIGSRVQIHLPHLLYRYILHA